MKIKNILVLLLLSFCCLSFVFGEDEGKRIFEEKCDKCHSLDRALSLTKDESAWRRTVERMAKKIEGIISGEDVEKITKYLAGRETIKQEIKQDNKNDTQEKIAEYEGEDTYKKVKVNQFIKPDVCGGCHEEIYKQWKGSMHSKAFIDPIWRASTKLFYSQSTTKGQILEMRACVKCHTPLGFRSYLIQSPKEDYEKLEELPAQGIFCNWCHNINEVKHIGDSHYDVEAGGGENDPSIMLGPRSDANSDFHPTKYSELFTKSEFCGLCHNVSHAGNKMPIEQTYSEWEKSPYNTNDPKTTVVCQDCHMRQRPGVPATGKTVRPDNPGKSAIDGPQRDHIWTHYIVGGNSIVPKVLGSDIHSSMAIERLTNAADLEIIRNGDYKKGKLGRVDVKVINSGAGHYLPTGLTEVRQIWLNVTITDKDGNVLLSSGKLDLTGEIEKNSIIFHTDLGNEKNEHAVNVALADKILYDHRIPPKGYQLEEYSFLIPQETVSPLKVDVVLRYRSASPEIARLLLGDKAPEIPVIDMVSLSEKIEF
ncbi:MAG: multiheme c-type cytochrome [bacterium]|nr:multiheme c-type cytochrome [bacterium]